MTSISRAWSKSAESLPPGAMTGKTLFISGKSELSNIPSLARIQLLLPRTVLISPLCAIKRIGWARPQEGNVLVL